MSKTTTTLPKFEDYKAPWEVDSDGNEVPEDEQQLDKGKLKKFLHGLLSDKARLQTTVATVTTERDTAREALDAKTREGEGDDAKRKREHEDAVKAAKAEGDLAALKYEIALEIDGITPKQAKRLAKRLTGSTREELEEDAKGLVEDFEIAAKPEGNSEDGGDGGQPAGRPKTPRASGDRDPNTPKLPSVDRDEVNKTFPRR